MKKIVLAVILAGPFLAGSGVGAAAQGFSAVSLIVHSAVVSRCEDRQLTQQEAQGTAIGWSSMWKAMRDCRENMAKRQAASKKK